MKATLSRPSPPGIALLEGLEDRVRGLVSDATSIGEDFADFLVEFGTEDNPALPQSAECLAVIAAVAPTLSEFFTAPVSGFSVMKRAILAEQQVERLKRTLQLTGDQVVAQRKLIADLLLLVPSDSPVQDKVDAVTEGDEALAADEVAA